MAPRIRWRALELIPIVVAARAGAPEAFDELVRRYKGAAIGVAYSILGQTELAEDVAQECFLVAFRALHQLRSPARFPSWLCAIARNRALRSQRERRKEDLVPLGDLEPRSIARFASLRDPGQESDRSETIARLHRLVMKLPPEYRVVLDLRYWRRLKTREIAASLGIPETTVKWRLHKGTALLRHALGDGQKE